MPANTVSGLPSFLSAAVRAPRTIGAVAPSSSHLADLLAAVVPRSGSPVVVELGPGTGSISRVVQRELPADGRHVAVEIDPVLAEHTRLRCPGVEVLVGDVANLRALLDSCGITEVDVVLSGLPWTLFDRARQVALLDEVVGLLGESGAFAAFSYLHARRSPGGRRFDDLLAGRFEEVMLSRTVWRNLPPARVAVCRRPVPVPPPVLP